MKFLSNIKNNLKLLKQAFVNVFGLFSVRLYLFFLISLNALIWVFCYLFFSRVSQKLIVLHYNIDFGVDLIGDVRNIFIIPALGLFVIFFNLLICLVFSHNAQLKFIINLLLASALIVNFFLSLSLGPIYLINFT